ncbi:MAG: hypothetical protein A2W22_02440 [Candidatus Levybacteria bacterium RBG_16_35_11]|nr:MAG: hypothetical protein A2W22_02440 [Candidatus Levybacteria bacterium RBG_16_35_11]
MKFIYSVMAENRKIVINYILYSLCSAIIFLISGYYSKLDNLILITTFFPTVFIPILLLIAYKGLYSKFKPLLYITAIFSSLLFYILMVTLRKPDLLNSPNIGNSYALVLLFSLFIFYFIDLFSYSIIVFFGIRFDDKIIDNIKTISCTIEDNTEGIKNLVKFLLTEFLGFEYLGKSANMEAHKFERNNNEFTFIRYSENQNPSTLLISYIMFNNDQDGVKAFDYDKINSFSLILEKFIGGNIITTPEGIRDEFNKYFSKYRPKIKEINEYFGKSQVNFREFKTPIIVTFGILTIGFAIFNIETITGFILNVDTDTIIKIAALIFALPTSIFYILKIFGKVK